MVVGNLCATAVKASISELQGKHGRGTLGRWGGSRMKSIKQLLPWKGKTLIEHSLQQLLAVKGKKYYVVLGAHYHELQAVLKHGAESYECLYNPEWKKGSHKVSLWRYGILQRTKTALNIF